MPKSKNNKPRTAHNNKSKMKLKWWYVVPVILVVTVAGYVIVRFSQADTGCPDAPSLRWCWTPSRFKGARPGSIKRLRGTLRWDGNYGRGNGTFYVESQTKKFNAKYCISFQGLMPYRMTITDNFGTAGSEVLGHSNNGIGTQTKCMAVADYVNGTRRIKIEALKGGTAYWYRWPDSNLISVSEYVYD